MANDFKFDFTKDKLTKILIGNKSVSEWYTALHAILPQYEINTTQRVAAFMAQCGHESAGFSVLKENLNYSATGLCATWPTRFPDIEDATPYHRNPEKIANKVYSNRMGNGNEASCDGFKYSGKGLIQLTGKANYKRFADAIHTPLADIPAYLTTIEGAVQSACWFWSVNKLNEFADTSNILSMTKIINGGVNGLADRDARYKRALDILKT